MVHLRSSTSPPSSAHTRTRRVPGTERFSERALLGRREIGLYPLILIAIGSFALALSHALRPHGQAAYGWSDQLVMGGAALVAVVVAAFAASQELGRGRAFLGDLRFYLGAGSVLLLLLAVAAVVDRGLESVSYVAVILVATYAGLVLPWRLSRFAVGGLVALSVVVQILRPDANLLDAGTVLALTVVGWLVGLLPRLGHRAASRQALLLSRGDTLTGALNRRGFVEQFAYDLHTARGDAALLIVDLNGFKQVNDTEGHAAGDAILAWVGATVPGVLPAGSAFGRLGGDEFAVGLPGAGAEAARGVALAIREALRPRIGASVGVATDPDRLADADTFMKAADGALYAAKADPAARVQYRPAVGLPHAGEAPATPPRPAITYDALRRAGGPPRELGDEVFDGRSITAGFALITLAGFPIVANAWLDGGHTFFEAVLRYLGAPWILANAAFAWACRNAPPTIDPARAPWWSSAFLTGGGVGAAALAGGQGIASPIMAAFALKLLFDGTYARSRLAYENAAMLAFFWTVVLVLSPRDTLWAAPYELAILGAAHVLGVIGRNAFEAARTTRLRIGSTDALTGLLNRSGFEAAAADRVAAAVAGRATLAVITFDLDDFKGVNDTQGHAAGDQLLRAVAHLTRDTLSDAYAIGRIGGDEFVALVPVPSVAALHTAVAELDRGLTVFVGGSIGAAIFGEDGTTYETLVATADARAYTVKQSRPGRGRGRRAAPPAAAPATPR